MRNENENPGRARWLRPTLLLLLFVAMPFGVASAQSPDMGAVTARLRQAIRNGELNADQARVMLDALRRSVAQQADAGAAKKRAAKATDVDWANVRRRLGAAVERGDMTREEAGKKFEALRRQAAQKAGGGTAKKGAAKAKDIDWLNVRRRLGAAVERGDMTREQAGKKFEALRRQAAQKAGGGAAKKGAAKAKDDVDWVNVRRRLGAAVERGDMTREEAGKKFEALRRQAAQKARGGAAKKGAAPANDVDWANVRRRLGAAVEAGKMTTEQARQKLTELRHQTARKQAAQKGGRRREY